MSIIITNDPNEDASDRNILVTKSIFSNDFSSHSSSCMAVPPKVTFIDTEVDGPIFSSASAITLAQSKNDSTILPPPPLLTLVNPSHSASVSNTNDMSNHKRPLTLLERRNREKNGMNMSSISGLSVETIQDSLCESYNTVIHEPAAPTIRGWSRKVKAFSSEDHYKHILRVLSKQHKKSFRTEKPNEPSFHGNSRCNSPVSFQQFRSLKGSFTIASYNILADRYVTTDRYPHCPPAALGKSYRIALIQKEVQQIAPDIITFAEMTVDAFENSLGGFLREHMHYDGEHLVITDRKGVPRCDMGAMDLENPAPLPLSEDTVRDGQENPLGDTSGFRTSYESPYSPALSGSPCATDYANKRGLAHDDKVKQKKKPLALFEMVSRRTEMEGVAIFYNRDRFKLLEKVPIRFNETAAQDPDITNSELKKLQANTHNVALINVLQDLTMPTQIYIVAAVHLLYENVKFQLWQSHCLLSMMESIKWKYQNYKKWLQQQAPVCSFGASSKSLNRDGETVHFATPAVPDTIFSGAFPDEQRVTCLIAGDLNVDKTSPVFQYILKSTVPASTPMLRRWCPSVEPGWDTPQTHAEVSRCGASESPQECHVTRTCLPEALNSTNPITAEASFGVVSFDPAQRTWTEFKMNAQSNISSPSQKSSLTTSSDVLNGKNSVECTSCKCCDVDESSADILPEKRTSKLQQTFENYLVRPRFNENNVLQLSDKREMCEGASSFLYSFPLSSSQRQRLQENIDSSVRDTICHIGVNTTDNFETSERTKKEKLPKCHTASGMALEARHDCNNMTEYTSPLGVPKHFDIDSTIDASNDGLKEEREIDISCSSNQPMNHQGLDIVCSEAIQKGSNMASVLLNFNPLPFKKLSATMFEHQMSPSWAHLMDHQEELDSPQRACHTFDQTISSFSHISYQWDSTPFLLELDASMYPPDKKSVPPPLCMIAPKYFHETCFSDTYEVYCISYPLRVSAVNPSTNMEGKVLDHILYEEDQLTCLSVLRLGTNMHLPTQNTPSDHYIVGALLVPNASLTPALEEQSQDSTE